MNLVYTKIIIIVIRNSNGVRIHLLFIIYFPLIISLIFENTALKHTQLSGSVFKSRMIPETEVVGAIRPILLQCISKLLNWAMHDDDVGPLCGVITSFCLTPSSLTVDNHPHSLLIVIYPLSFRLPSFLFSIVKQQVKVGIVLDLLFCFREDSSTANLTNTCNSNCSCAEVLYEPVCSHDYLQYYSPCHAGCLTRVETTLTVEQSLHLSPQLYSTNTELY